jgi:mannitol operon repressor
MPTRNPFDDAPPEIKELGHFSTEFNKESGRGASMVAASRLDEVLLRVLSAFLIDESISSDLIHGRNAPLGTFSSRIDAAYAMALIEELEYRELNLIRKIQNEFGHAWRDVGFDSAPVRDLCHALHWLGHPDLEAEKKPRERFNVAVVILLSDLLWRERLVAKERRIQKVWPNKMRN